MNTGSGDIRNTVNHCFLVTNVATCICAKVGEHNLNVVVVVGNFERNVVNVKTNLFFCGSIGLISQSPFGCIFRCRSIELKFKIVKFCGIGCVDSFIVIINTNATKCAKQGTALYVISNTGFCSVLSVRNLHTVTCTGVVINLNSVNKYG